MTSVIANEARVDMNLSAAKDLYSKIGVNIRPNPHGLFLVLIGPDGSGKTTLANALGNMIGGKYSGKRYFHWRPSILQKLSGEIPTGGSLTARPKQPAILDRVLSPVRLIRHVILFIIAYMFKIRPALRRGELVVGDKYIYPYFYAPATVKYLGPQWILSFALAFVPRPDILFCLQGKASVIRQRKPELSEEEIDAMIAGCMKVALKEKNVQLLDISGTLDQTLCLAIKMIQNSLKKRI
jgi:thymidylate kinase